MDEVQVANSGYGKRPLWQWILLYAIIAVVVYGLVYYFIFAKKGSTQPYQTPTSSVSPTAAATGAQASNIYMVKTDATKGNYMVDFAGMTLYIYDKDTAGISNCYGGCAKAWPPYTSGATAESNLPTNVTLVTRTDGTKQFAWKGMPLYYYVSDTKAGDITGDGVGGVWHIVKL